VAGEQVAAHEAKLAEHEGLHAALAEGSAASLPATDVRGRHG
jgi:hypothetical protein